VLTKRILVAKSFVNNGFRSLQPETGYLNFFASHA